MTLESSSLPIPSEVILPLAGYWFPSASLTFLGAGGRKRWFYYRFNTGLLYRFMDRHRKHRKRHLVNKNSLNKAVEWFKMYGAYAVFFTRLLLACVL
jgi:hypothetical protein